MARTVILSFVAQLANSATEITLHPGDLVESYRIRRDALGPGDGVYFMEFESNGQHLRCPLVRFQARTSSPPVPSEEQEPARDTAAIEAAVSEVRAGLPQLQ